ncbi:MAG: HIT family protein [Defluviitaleaceae bacterium]|nr:HIT family protein [Defluviitaleaceae bacterium]
MSDCLFCKIIAGEIPSYKIYEDDRFIAILNRFPAVQGSVLLLTKSHAENIFGVCEQELKELMPLAKKIAEKMQKTLRPDGINFLQNNGKTAGQEIFHYHLHIIPRFEGDSVKMSFPSTDPPHEQFLEIQEKLKL